MADQLDKDFEQFQDVIDQAVKEFGEFILPLLGEAIEKTGAVATAELLRSLKQNFVKQQAQAALLTVSFKKYGTAVESKRAFNFKQGPAEDYEAWVEYIRSRGGLKKVPGYANGKVPTESIAINRIIWGIKRGKSSVRKNKKQWFYKNFYGYLRGLSDDISSKTTKEAGDAVYRIIDKSVQKMNAK